MKTNLDPWDLAGDLLDRSTCRVKVAAVIEDQNERIFSWGWNSCGPNGMGLCAEKHAIFRANPKRIQGASIYVRGWNGVSESISKPCMTCYDRIVAAGIKYVTYTDENKVAVSTSVSTLIRSNLKRLRNDI